VEELGRWCGRCGTELRAGARFCSTCGQRVLTEEPAPLTGLDALFGAPTPAPGQPPTAPPLDEPPTGEPPPGNWSHWYADTAPRSPSRPPANQQPANQQLSPSRSPSPFYPQPPRAPAEQPGAPRPPEVLGWAMRPGGPGGSSGRERRSRAPLLWSVLSVAVVAAVVVFLFRLHPFSHHATVNDAANSAGTTAPASAAARRGPAARSASSAPVTEQQAASTVAGMLTSSVADRTAIDNAYNDVDGCGPNLGGDAAVFTRAASSRRAMLARLASMPGRAALPPALLSNLASAWQASLAADQGLATWASDEAAQGCVRDDTSDPGYQATVTPDNEADQFKTAFVAQWNPLATSYGLTTYQQDQL
jgi:hypothetical protein